MTIDDLPAPKTASEAAEGGYAAREIEARAEDAREMRYRLSVRGEAFVAERRRRRFRGFGPCAVATLRTAG